MEKGRVRINFNEELNGIELFFNHRLDEQTMADIKSQGFRWSSRQKRWYTKRTPEREQFVNEYFNGLKKEEKAAEVRNEVNTGTSTKVDIVEKANEVDEVCVEEKRNVFASYFNSVGGSRIYKEADMSIVDFRNEFHAGYFEKENVMVSIKNNDETIYIQELDGAMDSKGSGKLHVLSVGGICATRVEKDAVLYVCNELGVRKVSDLIKAVKEGFDFKNLRVDTREIKGNDLFSPFKEVAPLKKMPDKWTKTQLVKALCSGQIYRAACDYKMSDDYAFDAAGNCSRGKELSLPLLAHDYIEHWNGRTTSLSETERKDNKCILKVWDSFESVSLYFDLECDMEKGSKLREEYVQQREAENKRKEEEIISLSDVSVLPDKFYDVVYLEKDDNTGCYKERTEMVQGINLIDYEEPDKFHFAYEKTVGVNEREIIPDRLYTVSDLYHKADIDMSDERLIPMGNHFVVVSGQALLEMANAGNVIPYISSRVAYGNTFENVKNELAGFVVGKKRWGIDVSKVDYMDSMQRVCAEEMRVAEILEKGRSIGEEEKMKIPSLFDRISDIEKRRKQDGKGKVKEVVGRDFR